MVLPELATLRIATYEESSKAILGHRVLPIVGLRPGYKHIPLRNESGQIIPLATIFVHIKVSHLLYLVWFILCIYYFKRNSTIF